jgi:hypothetical protein
LSIPTFIEKIRELGGKIWRETYGSKNMAGDSGGKIFTEKRRREICAGKYLPKR